MSKSKAESIAAKSVVRYGNVPTREPIKKHSLLQRSTAIANDEEKRKEQEKRDKEDVGQYIQREIFENIPKFHTVEPRDKELHEEFKRRGDKLHDTLLKEVEDLGCDRFAVQHDPYNDPIMRSSFQFIDKEERQTMTDTGHSLSEGKFGSKYWGRWMKNVMILEKTSADEANDAIPQKPLTKRDILESKKKKMQRFYDKAIPSKLPGISFAVPKDDKSPWFDKHMMGNRNDVDKLYKYSLQKEIPIYQIKPELMRSENSDPDALGAPGAIRGGVMAQGPRNDKFTKPLTSNVDVPAVDRPKGNPKMTSFSRLGRDSTSKPQISQSTSAQYDVRNGDISHGDPTKKGSGFAKEKRDGPKDSRVDYPGPGTYNVPKLFDNIPQKDYGALIEHIQESEGIDYRLLEAHDLGKLAGFANGCNRQEHLLYGFCLDGNCAKRLEFERAILKTKQYARLGAHTKEQCEECFPEDIKEKMRRKENRKKIPEDKQQQYIGKWGMMGMENIQKKYRDPANQSVLEKEFIESRIGEPLQSISPLHLAAKRGDSGAIKVMHVLGKDVNVREGEKLETPLHLAVRNQQLEAVHVLLETFDGVIDVDIQNKLGDTALHIAARKGWKEFVEALCNADANPLLLNDVEKRPYQEAHFFSIQQMLKTQEVIFELRGELTETQQKVDLTEIALSRAEQVNYEREKRENDAMTLDQYFPGNDEDENNKVRGNSRASQNRSRASSRRRSTILELNEDVFDKEVDSTKINTALYRVVRKTTNLKDPKQNSYLIGYYPTQDNYTTKFETF